jgi:hypothetical protein
MTPIRKLIFAFWIFVAIMLLWQFYTYNQGLTEDARAHPRQEHFWFTNSVASPAAPVSSAHRDGADIQQTNFVVQNNTPGPGNFTCLVTLKNVGNAKGVDIQISVRPYRGVSNEDPDVGHQAIIVLSDDDQISQYNAWVTFPNLAPGESSMQSVVFLSRNDFKPGTNPNPQIMFETENAAAPTAH